MWHAGILVPRPGMEPVPRAVEAQSLNHWKAREVSAVSNFKFDFYNFTSLYFFLFLNLRFKKGSIFQQKDHLFF